jgi:nicotinamide mononucleotide (NMN) deamidase PncC
MITSVSGSSNYFLGGIVSYAKKDRYSEVKKKP